MKLVFDAFVLDLSQSHFGLHMEESANRASFTPKLLGTRLCLHNSPFVTFANLRHDFVRQDERFNKQAQTLKHFPNRIFGENPNDC